MGSCSRRPSNPLSGLAASSASVMIRRLSPSSRPIKAQAVESPTTFTAVRNISSSRSTPSNQGQAFCRHANGRQHHGQGDHSRTRHTRRTNGCHRRRSHNDQLVCQGQINAVDLRDENGRDPLVERRSVHIDGGPQRQNETGRFLADSTLSSQQRMVTGNVALELEVENASNSASLMAPRDGTAAV